MRVEKLLDDAGKTAGKTSSNDQAKPTNPVATGALAFPENYAAVGPGDQTAPAPRKN